MIDFTFDGRTESFLELIDKDEIIERISALDIKMEWKPYHNKWQDDVAYMNVPCSFDIETSTTNIGTEKDPSWVGFMYIWQFAIADIAICGRYWEEFVELLNLLKHLLNLKPHKRLPIYAHFASFEFQHLRNFIHVEKVFARKKRVIVNADFNQAFQLRCSWALSNMGLGKAIGTVPDAKYNKLSGDDFDYTKLRLPTTELTDMEYAYCFCDVMGLNEYLLHTMTSNNDNVTTLPMTSTGFIRREVRKEVLKNEANKKQVLDLALTPKLYVYCKTASRGGNTHANAYFTDVILDNVSSYDRKSSYPAEMVVADNFPVTGFRDVRPSNENFIESVSTSACLIDMTFYNIRVKKLTPIPYISISKCTRVKFGKYNMKDNGRVVGADIASMVITDVDFRIIDAMYEYDDYEISALYTAKRGHLNDEFRHTLLEQFITKCKLETGDPYLYNKFKNKINAYFGMMLTDICNPTITYNPNCKDMKDLWKSEVVDIKSLLSRYYKSSNSFLSYQHGLWVTANARYQLQLAINTTGMDTAYVDTDSDKFIENHDADFARLNEKWLELCDANDISPIVHVNGKKYVLGAWEKEKTATQFRTLGAKKYCCMYGDELKITVAGLSKEKGKDWLKEHGGIENFKIDTVVPAGSSGRTVSYYNDVKEPYQLTIGDCTFTNGSNIAVLPTSYTFGVSEDYLKYYTSVQ